MVPPFSVWEHLWCHGPDALWTLLSFDYVTATYLGLTNWGTETVVDAVDVDCLATSD